MATEQADGLCKHLLALTVCAGRHLAPKDDNGLSDPYVKIFLNDRKFKSKIIYKTLNPVWDQTFDLGPFESEHSLAIKCYDYDMLTADDFMGQFTIPLQPFFHIGQYDQWFMLQERGKNENITGDIHLRLTVTRSDLRDRLPLFGVALREYLQRQKSSGRQCPIPAFFASAIAFIEVNGMHEKGIFRIGGKQTEINQMKALLDADLLSDCEQRYSENVHNVTGLLKLYLRSLPTPLLLFDNYSAVLAAEDLYEQEKEKAVRKILASLPAENYDVLAHLLALMIKLSENSTENLMSAANLAIVVAPNLIWSQKEDVSSALAAIEKMNNFVSYLIQHATALVPIKQTSVAPTRPPPPLPLIKSENVNSGDVVRQAQSLFQQFDKDGNGTLDHEEFTTFFQTFINSSSVPFAISKDADEVMKSVDTDGNGTIDWKEFSMWWNRIHWGRSSNWFAMPSDVLPRRVTLSEESTALAKSRSDSNSTRSGTPPPITSAALMPAFRRVASLPQPPPLPPPEGKVPSPRSTPLPPPITGSSVTLRSQSMPPAPVRPLRRLPSNEANDELSSPTTAASKLASAPSPGTPTPPSSPVIVHARPPAPLLGTSPRTVQSTSTVTRGISPREENSARRGANAEVPRSDSLPRFPPQPGALPPPLARQQTQPGVVPRRLPPPPPPSV